MTRIQFLTIHNLLAFFGKAPFFFLNQKIQLTRVLKFQFPVQIELYCDIRLYYSINHILFGIVLLILSLYSLIKYSHDILTRAIIILGTP